jgi:hypothetical protein
MFNKGSLFYSHSELTEIWAPYNINKILYLNATKRDIKQIRPFAQSAHATIRDAITQPLAMFNKGSLFYSHCELMTELVSSRGDASLR